MGTASWFNSTAYLRVSIAVVWSLRFLLIISNLKAHGVSHWPPSASWYNSGVLIFFFFSVNIRLVLHCSTRNNNLLKNWKLYTRIDSCMCTCSKNYFGIGSGLPRRSNAEQFSAGASQVPVQKTQDTWVQSLGWKDPLEVEMATHSSILAWEIPWKRSVANYSLCGHKKNWTWLGD